jgi:hypothetical protein
MGGNAENAFAFPPEVLEPVASARLVVAEAHQLVVVDGEHVVTGVGIPNPGVGVRVVVPEAPRLIVVFGLELSTRGHAEESALGFLVPKLL